MATPLQTVSTAIFVFIISGCGDLLFFSSDLPVGVLGVPNLQNAAHSLEELLNKCIISAVQRNNLNGVIQNTAENYLPDYIRPSNSACLKNS
jgi:hypothetical protein